MQEVMVSVKGFCKRYGSFLAVDGVDFEVYQGEIFGLLGPNGAGKTTILESLEGLRLPDGGSMNVMGLNPVHNQRQLRNLVGIQLQSSGLPAGIKVGEAMQFFCAYHGKPPRYDLLERFDLSAKLQSQFHTLSTGQQRRLALALALAHRPRILFFDEPTAGLDVGTRAELHLVMKELREQGITILLSTHDMAEAEALADRVAILLRGKVAAIGTPRDLTAAGAGLTKISVRTSNNSLTGHKLPAVTASSSKDGYLVCFSSDIGPTLAAIIACINENQDTLIDLRVERPSLEERFLELIKEGA